MAQFRLIAGRHSRGTKLHGTRKVYKVGAILESLSKDEEKFFSKYPDKFERLHDRVTPRMSKIQENKNKKEEVESDDEGFTDEEVDVEKLKESLHSMTNVQLQKFAKEYNININHVGTKPELIQVISAALDMMAE